MGIRNSKLGGTDFTDGEVLYGATDLNDTNNAIINNQQLLGEVKMFALSMSGAVTKAALQAKGWAICDGTTPASQGISTPTIATTPDLQERFIRMSDDETSGTEAGSDTHIHQWLSAATLSTNNLETDSNVASISFPQSWEDDGSTLQDVYSASNQRIGGDQYTKELTSVPAYTEMAFFIKVKIV